MAVHASRRGLLLHRHQNLSGSRLARVRAWRRALGQCCTTPLKSAPARLTLTPHPNFRPLHPVQGAFRLIPILFEEHLGFHSGYPGPLPQIPECRPQLSDSSSQVNPQPCSSRRDNSSTQLHGINWQQQLSYLPPDVLTQATSAPLNFSDFDLSFSDGAAWSADSSSSGLQTDGLQAFPQDHIDVSLGMDAIYSLTTLSSGVFTTMPSSAPLLQTIYNTSPQISDQGLFQTSHSSPQSQSQSPENGSPSSERSPKLSTIKSSSTNSASRVEKRKQNTLAARRYRQKRVDQMSSLEASLKETQTERDDLKVKCARLEGEVETLRALLAAKK